jgi:tRNA(Arg) A34 adenosine deaminase TadA
VVTRVDGMTAVPVAKGEPLDGAWSVALVQAWEAFRTGSTPVGAVVVALDGTVVAAGRGRRYEPAGPSGQLAGTHVAHAEVNALAQLGTSRHGDGHTLLTTLEPCGMCHDAAVQPTLSRLVFAAPDPYRPQIASFCAGSATARRPRPTRQSDG